MRYRFSYLTIGLLFLGTEMSLKAQHYQAVHGSSKAGGSLTVGNNPASILHIPYSWDLTLFSFQDQHTTNAFILKNASLLKPTNMEIGSVNGQGKRFLFGNQDVHLLNARIRLNRSEAIAFGINIRSTFSATTSNGHWQDTLQDLNTFLDLNTGNLPLSARARASSWAEIFASYARTIIDDGSSILNAGVTLSVNRGLGGAYLDADQINYFPSNAQGNNQYNLATGELRFGYSANIDDAKDDGFKQFMKRTLTGVSLSAGIEYIIPSFEGESEYDYDWKIGVSAMDLGFSTYQFSNNSRYAVLNKENISDSIIEARFENVETIEEAMDTLSALAGSSGVPTGNFHITQPARLVINADRHLQGNFYINGELTIPLTSLLSDKYLFLRDINLLAVTPRYETRLFGAYLPVTFNTQKQLWVGGAFRAGPLLLGVHNWANLFAKDKLQRGGVYLALTFRPGKKREGDSKTSRDAGIRLSKKEQRYLDCFKF
jgi:hypothetical protein